MEIYQELLYVHIMTRASANIDLVLRAQGKIEFRVMNRKDS